MACLDTTTKSLTIELSSSPTAQADWTVHYGRKSAEGFAEVNAHGATSNTAQVTMVSPPAEGEVLSIRDITVFNNDISAITFKIRLFDGLTSRVLYAQTLDSQEAWSSLAQKGRDGAAGATGTVNAASGLLLDESNAPNTVYNQGAIYVNNNELFFRRENNAQPFLISGQREVLTANRTYYVRTDGNDSNDGLSDSAGGAFLTIQKALDIVGALDISIYDVTIQVGNGTYNEALTYKSPIGSGSGGLDPVYLKGDLTTPSNVVINATGTAFNVSNAIVPVSIGGFKVISSSAGILVSGKASFCRIYNLEWGACDLYMIYGVTGGSIALWGDNYTISGNTQSFIYLKDNSFLRTWGGITHNFTLTGTPVWGNACVFAEGNSTMYFWGGAFTGSATGKRYHVLTSSVITSTLLNASFFPGSIAGTADATTFGSYS